MDEGKTMATVVKPTGPADLRDQKRLTQLEAVIERGKEAWLEVGKALAEIRDNRLYRATHSSFEDYCRDRWGFTRQRGMQLIDAAHVVGALPQGLTTSVDNEAQARALAPTLKAEGPAKAAEVLAAAATATLGKPTAAAIAAAAAVHRTPRATQTGQLEEDLHRVAVLARWQVEVLSALHKVMAHDPAEFVDVLGPRERVTSEHLLNQQLVWTRNAIDLIQATARPRLVPTEDPNA